MKAYYLERENYKKRKSIEKLQKMLNSENGETKNEEFTDYYTLKQTIYNETGMITISG